MTVGDRIKSRREMLGMSQEELAQKCGYSSRSSIARLEGSSRNLPYSRARLLADALETTPEYLLGWDTKDPGQIEFLTAQAIRREESAKNIERYYEITPTPTQPEVRGLQAAVDMTERYGADRTRRLLEYAEKLQSLSDEQRAAVESLIDSMTKK